MENLPLPPTPKAAPPSAQSLAAAPQAKVAVEQFEAMLLGELTSLMIGTAPSENMFGGGHAEEIYKGLMAEHLGSAIARRGGLGLAPALMDEVIRMQGER